MSRRDSFNIECCLSSRKQHDNSIFHEPNLCVHSMWTCTRNFFSVWIISNFSKYVHYSFGSSVTYPRVCGIFRDPARPDRCYSKPAYFCVMCLYLYHSSRQRLPEKDQQARKAAAALKQNMQRQHIREHTMSSMEWPGKEEEAPRVGVVGGKSMAFILRRRWPVTTASRHRCQSKAMHTSKRCTTVQIS
jgi:hypothetical protein